ncbi:MAG TPA: prolyl aminopeptidase [Kribbella sp.]|uniref:prolyl aminopeptidase n=1 Tax=Kribbella sp. TaxID=1871183 RepID=UPI002D76F0FC|nr:prolyl aminopeptidase [Kribbella sp.]HET6299274.1 prolyl aminopeptidase [Kribbella sp.]
MYPETEPYDHGMLEVGDGQLVYWEVCGNPDGKPAVVVHGGPGSGAGPSWRRFFDPAQYKVVLFDQRGCGRSTPDAAGAEVDLSTNTTWHLVADMEKLREHLGIEKWLLLGASWGATLGFAYAEQHPGSVSEIVLFSVTNTTAREVEWVTRDMGRVFPEEWARFRDGVPASERDGNLALAYSRLLHDPDPAVREKAARDWCDWEDTHIATHPAYKPDPRYQDPVFRLRFARLVTHYWGHAAWIEDGALLRDAGKLAGIPGVLIHGRLDLSSPADIPWKMAQAWPDAELHLVEDGGHGTGTDLVLQALDRFAN